MTLRRILLLLLACAALGAGARELPKREFRGAWMHTVFQGQYHSQTTEQNKAYLTAQLDSLQRSGVNAVLFQVRPSADAFYPSSLEPWSRFLTDGGAAPKPYWDPLQFMVEQTHARGMELHAWLNPYRVTAAKGHKPAPSHLYYKEPWRFVTYAGDGKIYFDPGLPENRRFIERVVMDIVSRYDVDAIHFDDYFYPYPAAGKDFPDDASYAKYGAGMSRGDWRRHNVDLLIEEIHDSIQAGPKPWVRFGISPFGIWRNKANDPRGSDTKGGLQNYDDLYADVLLWAERGWIDYLLPQLYWELEHPVASSEKLIGWWAEATPANCHLYIGQDVERTMKKPDKVPGGEPTQLNHKLRLSRETPGVKGNCWWPAYSVTRNSGGVLDSLAMKGQCRPAIVPAYPALGAAEPARPHRLVRNGQRITWQAPAPEGKASDAVRFAVYHFALDTAEPDTDSSAFLVAVTADCQYPAAEPGIYMVSSLSRTNVESVPVAIVVK